jgi:hypothetical protein
MFYFTPNHSDSIDGMSVTFRKSLPAAVVDGLDWEAVRNAQQAVERQAAEWGQDREAQLRREHGEDCILEVDVRSGVEAKACHLVCWAACGVRIG